ncbi:hypothetical protein PHYBLDRAFT_59123 [Phycomyces blakesleeanus NRRL 1555(-)]|uniref:Uncharacterized protein n=1 Tax=Phycomyces blakesleeanus (strain ATCC 8743b / DSM 1359 / FGSC 10004 / NBRC 33097 / NRRL 1555) TaxID=763407 RepID=A0A162V5B6_PHYB8|nr:hypothetical protein PHYBLDRAFT_59123 [Phycomyces blakesleeanus NRRL 1555(-)]OAD80082.1 hypothetical protein PHYBLDRAFT_59123 [Phycomyces blakesleeanus NRRL 1555(-)]|eukprot:XP_018298122.1 hypothetical protein PHYBLDRAFT_59123 [Phycomyces blakesleeanus NRRL 1555(-)]
MSNIDQTVVQLLQGIHNTLVALHKDIREVKENMSNKLNVPQDPEQVIITSVKVSTGPIPRPIGNIRGITTKHVHDMMVKDLGIQLTKESKSTLQTCTHLACDQLAHLPSVQSLGPSSSWQSISQVDKKRVCDNHASVFKECGIDFVAILTDKTTGQYFEDNIFISDVRDD